MLDASLHLSTHCYCICFVIDVVVYVSTNVLLHPCICKLNSTCRCTCVCAFGFCTGCQTGQLVLQVYANACMCMFQIDNTCMQMHLIASFPCFLHCTYATLPVLRYHESYMCDFGMPLPSQLLPLGFRTCSSQTNTTKYIELNRSKWLLLTKNWLI